MTDSNEFYLKPKQQLQSENDIDRLAAALVSAIVAEEIQDDYIDVINSPDFFFLSLIQMDS